MNKDRVLARLKRIELGDKACIRLNHGNQLEIKRTKINLYQMRLLFTNGAELAAPLVMCSTENKKIEMYPFFDLLRLFLFGSIGAVFVLIYLQFGSSDVSEDLYLLGLPFVIVFFFQLILMPVTFRLIKEKVATYLA